MRQDPQSDQLPAHPQRTGPRRARGEYRHLAARLLLVPGMGAMITGMVIEHGVLMMAGLVVTGVAGHLATPRRGDDSAKRDDRFPAPQPPRRTPPRS